MFCFWRHLSVWKIFGYMNKILLKAIKIAPFPNKTTLFNYLINCDLDNVHVI